MFPSDSNRLSLALSWGQTESFQQDLDLDLVMEPEASLESLLFKGDFFAIRKESEQFHSYLIILVVN